MSNETAEYELFSGPEVPRLLQLALTGSPDIELQEFTVQLHKLHHRPGTDVSAGYEVSYVLPDGTAVSEYLVATTNDLPEDARAVRLTGEGMSLSVWRHPDDPFLPALGPACSAVEVADWLGSDEEVGVEVVSYRPMRRAVLRYTIGDDVVFAKVVRPRRVGDLAARHLMLAEAGISPAVLGEPAPGALLLASAHGQSLATVFAAARQGHGTVPDPQAFVTFLDRLPQAAMRLRRRESWSERVEFHGAAAAMAVADREDEVVGLVRELEQLLAAAPLGPEVPTHGDFYEANIFVADDLPHHVIDVDSLGPGYREDDLACLLAHMAVLPALSPDHYAGLESVCMEWAETFEQSVRSVVALRARVAAVILSLVAGGSGGQREVRLDLAQQWAARARAAAAAER